MTKKHFKALAEAIQTLPDASREQAASAVADAVAQFNDRFDRKRFIKLCGVSV